jgi:hypothetical protein
VSSIDPTLNCEYNALRTVHVHQHIRGPLTVEMYTKMARYFYENDKHSDQYAVEIYNLYLKMSTNDR